MTPFSSLRQAALLTALAISLAGCGRRDTAPAVAANEGPVPLAAPGLPSGSWRAVLTLPGGELPFTLELARERGALVAYLINGAERLRVAETAFAANVLTLRMPGFENTLTASVKDGRLSGELLMIKSGAKRQQIPFSASPGDWRFFDTATPGSIDVTGRWAVQFTEDSGDRYIAVGEFRQEGTFVTGTFLTPTGDHRFLAGDVRGKDLFLSVFDGGHAFLYHAQLGSNGELTGDYWSGLASHETWTARRDEQAGLGDSESATRLRTAKRPFNFSFPDLDGHPVSLSDAAFKGKVVIVTLAGSWCPNCHDAAAFLSDLYKRDRGRGLEIVSLMFEQFGDFAQAVGATKRFRREFAIEYPTLIAGISDKDDAATRLPQLNGVYAFPTTLFIDRRGQVRRIHTGFSGPATGDHYRQLVAQYESTTELLLTESAGH